MTRSGCSFKNDETATPDNDNGYAVVAVQMLFVFFIVWIVVSIVFIIVFTFVLFVLIFFKQATPT